MVFADQIIFVALHKTHFLVRKLAIQGKGPMKTVKYRKLDNLE